MLNNSVLVRLKKPPTFHAIRFDPAGEHRLTLPLFVSGSAAPGADNWGYEGCWFSVDGEPITAGDWIVYEGAEAHVYSPCAFEAKFETF